VKKILVPTVLAIAALAIPAYAGAHGGKPQAPGNSGATHGKSHKCKTHSVGYVASGTLNSYGLTQTAGADTPADTSDDRYSGTLDVTVTHTNHHAKGATSPFTLTNVRVTFGEGVTQPPAAGTVVHLIGKVTAVAKKCTDKSQAGVVTFRKVVFSVPSTDTQD
jgi:hypothetical protein